MHDWSSDVRRRLSGLNLSPEREAEIVEELSQHLDDRYQELSASGTSTEESIRLALEGINDEDLLASELAMVATPPPRQNAPGPTVQSVLSSLYQDARYAMYLLRSSPGFTITALLMLAIGIGANATVFSIVNGVFLTPLPFEHPEQLVMIWSDDGRGTQRPVPIGDLKNLQSLSQSFEYEAVQVGRTLALESEEVPVRVQSVSADYFKVFRVRPILGRDFSDDDARSAASPVVVISHAYWKSRFAGDPLVVGKLLRLKDNNPPLTIIGVLPPDFHSPSTLTDAENLWSLMDVDRDARMRAPTRLFARLKTGVTLAQAQGELTSIQARVLQTDLMYYQRPLNLQSMLDFFIQSSRTTIWIFSAAVFSVLFIVIVNLAGLEMSRFPRYEHELSIRAALGASRARLVQLMLVKALVLGMTGGLLGIGMAWFAHRTLIDWAVGIPRKGDIRIDSVVLLYSLGLAILSSLLVAVVPAIRASRLNLREMIGSIAASYTPSRKSRIFQDALNAAEIALALILVIAAGLLLNSFWKLASVDLGFEPRGVSAIRITLPATYALREQASIFSDVIKRVGTMSDSQAVTVAQGAPIQSGAYTSARPAGAMASERSIPIQTQGMMGQYFSTLRIPVLAGRSVFTEEEMRNNAPVAIVTASFAAAFWPRRNPVGQQFQMAGAGQPVLTVIGMVGDVRDRLFQKLNFRGMTALIQESMPLAYVPLANSLGTSAGNPMVLLTKSAVTFPEIQDTITAVEPRSVTVMGSLDAVVTSATAPQLFQATVIGAFALIAILLAVLGVYSVVSHSVARRTREIGLRMALGAQSANIFTQILRQALVPTGLGLLMGFAGSIAVQKVLTIYLYEIQPNDAPTYAVVVSVVAIASLAACAIPAYRATRLDPQTALRTE